MTKELTEITLLATICSLMKQKRVRSLAFKRLAPNDNSKNQIYLGGDYAALQILPFDEVVADKSRKDSKRDRYKAQVNFFWLDADSRIYPAPNAQLILYPKYPEVRMSGFIKNTERAPRRHLTSRRPGRVLMIGITEEGSMIGHVVGPGNPMMRELDALVDPVTEGVFAFVFKEDVSEDSRKRLLARLNEIAEMGWVNSMRLNGEGKRISYKAQNGGGYTLEALLGILPNGRNEPDFLGWEIKQHKSANLEKPLTGGAISLITPEPSGGVYRTEGVEAFVRKFGYPDRNGIADRLNFGGIHRFGEVTASTSLRLELSGYDISTGKIEDVSGGICLVAHDGTEAAIWHYASLLEKWNRKHERAAYVPSESRIRDRNPQYRYGFVVALREGTDFLMFLNAIAQKAIYYDPGIKLEGVGSLNPRTKRRSQFRIKPQNLGMLYRNLEERDVRHV